MTEIAQHPEPGLARRRWATVALALVAPATGVLAAGATLVPSGAPVSPAALGIAAGLVALALAYAVHILYLVVDAPGPDDADVSRAIDRATLPILAGAMIVALLFLGLRWGPTVECRHLGLSAAAGVAAAALAAVFLLPRLLPLLAATGRGCLSLSEKSRRFLDGHAARRRTIVIVLAACTLLSFVGLSRLRLAPGPTTPAGVAAEARHSWRAIGASVRRAIRDEAPADRFRRDVAALEPTPLDRADLLRFGALGAVVSAGLLGLLFGRLTLVAIALLPVGAGVLWTLGALGLGGVALSLPHLLALLFVVGLALDFSLFLLHAKLDPIRGLEDRSATVGASVLTGAMIVTLGATVLTLLGHPILSATGITLFLGSAFSLLAAFLLVPLCLDVLTARRRARHRAVTTVSPGTLDYAAKLRAVSRRYLYQGPYPEQFVYWKMRTDPVFRALDGVLPARGEFLDLGCGYGMASHWLLLDGPDRSVIGMDFDAVKVRVAQASAQGLDRLRIEHGDLLRWRYPACDHVLLLDVLHYVPREAKAQVLRRAFAAMRPSGVLIVREALGSEATGHRRVARAERWAVRLGQNRTAHGLHFETREAYEELVRQAGFAGAAWKTDAGLGSNALLVATR